MLSKNVIPKVIIIVGFIISSNLYWAIFGGPIWLIGLVYFLLQKRTIKSKIIWTLWPPMLVYPAFIAFIYISGTIGMAAAQKLEFRFPEGFRGTAVIIYDSECGQDQIIENGREILMIPKNGICFYKGNIASGIINHSYKISNGSTFEELPTLDRLKSHNENKTDSTKLGVYLKGMSTRTIYPNKKSFSSVGFILSSTENFGQYFDFHYTKNLDGMVDSLWRLCQTSQVTK